MSNGIWTFSSLVELVFRRNKIRAIYGIHLISDSGNYKNNGKTDLGTFEFSDNGRKRENMEVSS